MLRCLLLITKGFIGAAGIYLIMQFPGYAEMTELPRGKGDFCVEPTDVMRKNHMQLLHHQRDRTVHQGVRTKRHSLIGCVGCHVQTNSQGQFIPVNAPQQFCETCHSFASVKLDCFECHATTPDVLDASNEYNAEINALKLEKLYPQPKISLQTISPFTEQHNVAISKFLISNSLSQ